MWHFNVSKNAVHWLGKCSSLGIMLTKFIFIKLQGPSISWLETDKTLLVL